MSDMNKCLQAAGVNHSSRVSNQQQVALHPPPPPARVPPRLNPDAGAACVHGHRCDGGVGVERREGCKLSSRVLSFAERCTTCFLIEPHMSGLASSLPGIRWFRTGRNL